MPFLADTNILLRVLQRGDPDHAIIRAALRKLKLCGETIHYLSQNLAEFWRVCMRPKSANGLGMSVPATDSWARVIERIFLLRRIVPKCIKNGAASWLSTAYPGFRSTMLA